MIRNDAYKINKRLIDIFFLFMGLCERKEVCFVLSKKGIIRGSFRRSVAPCFSATHAIKNANPSAREAGGSIPN